MNRIPNDMPQTQFFCGAAKAEITPTDLDGLFGLMQIPFAGVLDPLYLRVLAFSDGIQKALIISFDLDKAPNPASWLPEISLRTGIPEENITYIGTHTHSAPLTTYRPKEHNDSVPEGMRKAMNAYEEMVWEKLRSCVDRAIAELRPAKLGCATGESYININRNAEFTYEAPDGTLHDFTAQGMNDRADVDRTVFVCKVEEKAGRPIAFFINYAIHCCTMFRNRYGGGDSMGISGDIAGTVSRYLEAQFPGSVAVWSSGAAGDINPVISNELFYPDPSNGSRKETLLPDAKAIHAVMLSLAARHYADVLRVVRNISCPSGNVRIGGAVEWSETPSVRVRKRENGSGYEVLGDGEAPYRIRMHLLRLGDVALCGIGGELYGSFGKMLKEASPMQYTVILNHDASLIDDCGYVLDDETLTRVRRAYPVPGMVPGASSASKTGCVGPSLLAHMRCLLEKEMEEKQKIRIEEDLIS